MQVLRHVWDGGIMNFGSDSKVSFILSGFSLEGLIKVSFVPNIELSLISSGILKKPTNFTNKW
jgi:hypothetical protein